MGLNLIIVSPEKQLFEGEVEGVTVPGAQGRFEVLVNHAPIISSLNKGTVIYRTAKGEETLDIDRGFIEVSNNKVSLCVEQDN